MAKKKKCKYCMSDVHPKARICPYCNKTLRDGCSGILGAVLLIVALAFIVVFFFM